MLLLWKLSAPSGTKALYVLSHSSLGIPSSHAMLCPNNSPHCLLPSFNPMADPLLAARCCT